MIRRPGLWLLAAIAIGSPAAAQLRPQATATTRLLDPIRGSGSPAVWLGFDLDLDRDRWGGRFTIAGAPGRNSWGGEASLSARGERPLGSSLSALGRLDGLAERPIGSVATREGAGRLGLGYRTGSVRLEAGGLVVGSSLIGGGGVGAFAGGRVILGRLRLQGEIGQVTTLAGSSMVEPSFGNTTAQVPDTGVRRNSARRLGHGVIGGTWNRDWLEVSGRLIRRSRLAPDDRMGWELGVGVTPISGIRFIVMAARAPIGPSIYLPFRRQLTFGMALADRRRRPLARVDGIPVVAVPIGIEVVTADHGPTRIRFRHPRASRIEVVGDFTDWAPVALGQVLPGVFELDFRLAPGIHLVNVRIDGGPLEVPPGLDGTDDGFGGRAGILVVR